MKPLLFKVSGCLCPPWLTEFPLWPRFEFLAQLFQFSLNEKQLEEQRCLSLQVCPDRGMWSAEKDAKAFKGKETTNMYECTSYIGSKQSCLSYFLKNPGEEMVNIYCYNYINPPDYVGWPLVGPLQLWIYSQMQMYTHTRRVKGILQELS